MSPFDRERVDPAARRFDMTVGPIDCPHDQALVDAARPRIVAAQAQIQAGDRRGAAVTLEGVELPASAPLEMQLALAEALAQGGEHERSDALYERLLLDHGGSRRLHLLYAKRLHVRGLAIQARELLDSARPFPAGSIQHAFVKRVRRLCEVLQSREGRAIGPTEDCRLLAMTHALASYRSRVVPDVRPDRIGRLILITGSLGAGGAERQLSRAAAGLEARRRSGKPVGPVTIEGPIEVLVRSHSEQGRDVYLGDLTGANVAIAEIDRMPTCSINTFGIDDPDLVTLLDYLPIRVNFGVRRLVTHFQQNPPQVVSLWQDGACLFAAIAALIAGVPRIQLMFRGLPPIIRKHMFQPEYESLYRGLAEIPGIQFVSNSRRAAEAYAEWIGIPVERFAILYNGVQRMTVRADPALDLQWQAFLDRTPGTTHVVGGVFRFDTDKRPTTWIRFAARYAKRHPDARFVIVGGGRLFDHSVQLARDLGVADRILFAGHSDNVAYWMAKMDVLVLMSSFEGLPNVLIEAQYLGVPVVSTPAGGASECFIEGVTGHVLGCADKTDLDEACDKVRALVGCARDPAIFEPATREFLEPNFSVPRMLENFVEITCR